MTSGHKQFSTACCLPMSVAASIVSLGLVFLSGCGDFFNTKPTELESKVVLDELSQVRESPHINNPLPEVYRQPPGRVAVGGGVKLFYFAKNLSVKQLADLVSQQLGYQIAQNPSTNQLVVYCADDAQADLAVQYIEMVDVPPVQVNVDCLILERFGDVTMDWETTLLVEDLFGTGVTLGETKYPKPAFPGASLREPERSEFGLDFGHWINRNQSGDQVRTVVDVLISRGYLKILLNPQLETVNGQKATVTIKDFAPIQKIQMGKGGYVDVYNITEYVWVANTLTVTPFVYADGSIGLTTDIKIGSRSKPEGVVQRSIITERSINVEENRIQPGHSLIIGGMRKSEKRDVIRGVPFLKDLPLVGVLFSSRDFEEKATEIIFILTPSISGGSKDHKQVVSEIRTRYADPDVKRDVLDYFKDPLGSGAYTSMVEKEAVQAELDRVNAELVRQEVENKAAAEKQYADAAATEAAALRKEAQRLQSQAQKEQAEAEKAGEAAKTAQSATQNEAANIAAMEAEKQKAQKQADEAQFLAQQAQEKAARAAQNAKLHEQKAQQAVEDAIKAQEAARKASEKAQEKARQAAEEKARKEEEKKARLEAEEKARQNQANPNEPQTSGAPNLPEKPQAGRDEISSDTSISKVQPVPESKASPAPAAP